MLRAKITARKLPYWLRRPLPAGGNYERTGRVLERLGLRSVCTDANCPNRGVCWQKGTATILILGPACTRNCRFCSVAGGRPSAPDPAEPGRIARFVEQLQVKYLVLTSVTRDDLPDGGAGHFRDCIRQVRRQCPGVKFEILVPDFRHCQAEALEVLRGALPFVFAHNVETVPRLYRSARPGADYQDSLRLLELAKTSYHRIETKSSIMLGLGESDREVMDVLTDLRRVGCSRITIGQYLKPSAGSLDVVEYVRPEKFGYWREVALSLGFSRVCSEPYARSSYLAGP